jgi:hypothetical protein
MPLATPLWSRAIQISLENVAPEGEPTTENTAAAAPAADLIAKAAQALRSVVRNSTAGGARK